MPHPSHVHHHLHSSRPTTSDGLRIAFILNLSFTFIEIGGGLWTNSAAILADAVHDFGDSLALASAWLLERMSRRGSDARYTFGYRRFSLLGAVLTALVLLVGGIVVLIHAIPRLFSPELPHAPGMMVIAVLGIAVNGSALLQLRKGEGANNRAVTWHIMEDVLGWIAVLVAGSILLFVDWPLLDPLLSIGITLFVMRHVVKQLRAALRIFLQRTPDNVSVPTLTTDLRSVPGVVDLHHVHVWSLDEDHHIFSAHVDVDDHTSPEERERIRKELHDLLTERGLEHSTLEIEAASQPCPIAQTGHGDNITKD